MALNGNACGTAIATALAALAQTTLESGHLPANQSEKIYQTICNTLFAHIEANGVVTTPGITSGMSIGTGSIS